MNHAIKMTGETDDAWLIEGLILPYGGILNGQDLTGSHFTKSTDYAADWFPDGGRPGLYAHGFDPELGLSVVGREIKSWKDDKGVWLQAQIDKAHQYAGEIKELVDRGLVSLSSGAVDHLTKISAKTGEIAVWPWVEWSIVPNPANPEAVVYSLKSVDAVAHLAVVDATVPDAVTTDAVKASEEAEDAISAAYTMTGLIDLLGDESDPEQAARLRTAIDAVTAFIGGEVADIGTPEDLAETAAEEIGADMPIFGYLSVDGRRTILTSAKAGARNSASDLSLIQTIHDASIDLGATCSDAAGKSLDVPPAPGLAVKAGTDVETPSPDELAAIAEMLSTLAVKTAREVLRVE